MKRFTLLGLSLALFLFGNSAMAETNGFQALNMPYDLTSMTDEQLASVEGAFYVADYCIACVNVASITQININDGGYAEQTNNAFVMQSISGYCVGCVNTGSIFQVNINNGGYAKQTNNAVVIQSIN